MLFFLQFSSLEPGFEPLAQKLTSATIQIFGFGLVRCTAKGQFQRRKHSREWLYLSAIPTRIEENRQLIVSKPATIDLSLQGSDRLNKNESKPDNYLHSPTNFRHVF